MPKLRDRRLEQYFARLAQADRYLPAIAAQVEREALAWAIQGANLNIYNTASGAYERTREYLRGLSAQGGASAGRASVRLSNTVPYAIYVELGRGGMSAAMLQQAAMLSPSGPLTLGRSGQAWWTAGPVLISAQVYARRRLAQLFWQRVRAG